MQRFPDLAALLAVGVVACATGEVIATGTQPGMFQSSSDAAATGAEDGSVAEGAADGSSIGSSSGSYSTGDDSGGAGSASGSSVSTSGGSGEAGGDDGGVACTACNGCCDSTGTCQPGVVDTLCGAAGAMCIDCTVFGQACMAGGCAGGSSSSSGGSSASSSGAAMPCGLQTCNHGCCDSSGTCQPGTATAACGNQAQRCMDCTNRGLNHTCGPTNLHNLCL